MNISEECDLRFDYKKIRIGLRTIKTVAAVTISMAIISSYGLSASKIIFAMLGAMATMENTFKESLEACLTQVVGMVFGTIMGVILLSSPIPYLIDAGIGVMLVIILYNVMCIRYSPTLPCMIVVTMCTTPDILPFDYALGRLLASGIGLLVGLLINTLVFPYDNSSKIRATIDYLDKELLRFLEDMFDGDNHLPNTEKMSQMIDDMRHQLKIFSGQSILLYRAKKRNQLETFQACVGKERQLVAQMEVLSRIKQPGRLNEENRKKLKEAGANIKDERTIDVPQEHDIITNYHVEQLISLRKELLDVLAVLKEETTEK